MFFRKPKPLVPVDEFDWLMACLAWAHRSLGAGKGGEPSVPALVTPVTPKIAAANSASSLFNAVKVLAGLQDWFCELQQGETPPDPRELTAIGEFSSKGAAGTFSIENNTPIIRYDPNLLRDPERLVAVFAHELAHLVGHGLGPPPGGEELDEHGTDCLAVYLGFGVFMANGARNFSQFSDGQLQGWHSSVTGYLSEQALVTLTAMFLRLFAFDSHDAAIALKPYLRKDLQSALKHIDHAYPDFPEALAAVDLSDWA